MLKASVVIPTYNKATRLRLVLASFRYQSIPIEDFEIIVVDDGSTDTTAEVVSSYVALMNIKYLIQNNVGRSHARNRGVLSAESKLIVFCDDDCIVSKNFLYEHIKLHAKHVNTIVHGRIYNLPYMKFFSDPSKGILFEQTGANAENSKTDFTFLKRYLISCADMETLKKVEVQKKMTRLEKNIIQVFEQNLQGLKWLACTGGNISIMAEDFLKIGRFDEELDDYWGCEDLEMGYRALKNEMQFFYAENAENYHISHVRRNFEKEMLASFSMLSKKYDAQSDKLLLNIPMLLLGKVKTSQEYYNDIGNW